MHRVLGRTVRERSRNRPQLEELESRHLPSATITPAIDFRSALGPPNVVLNQGAFGPSQVRHAYGFDQISFMNRLGQTITGDGRGQSIAIVDAYDDPNIASDLATFDQNYGLPAPPVFRKWDEFGSTNYPAVDSGWDLEISLDVEWAHAIAPKANIILFEANSNSFTDMLTAVDTARHLGGVTVVSMSWGGWETQIGAALDLSTLDGILTTPAGHIGITFVASAGDNGAAEAPEWPAASPHALAIGGTTLTTSDAQGTYGSEAAWYLGGGGIATWEAEPSWQTTVQNFGKRTNPDVSIVGDPQTGVAVYDSVPYTGTTGTTSSGWFQVGGTSAGSPMWSALIAIANQGRVLAGKAMLNQAQAIVYFLSASDFHDVTSGTNGYPADSGYDLATGLGTPMANLVVRDLVRDNHVVNVPPGILPNVPFVTKAVITPYHLAASLHASVTPQDTSRPPAVSPTSGSNSTPAVVPSSIDVAGKLSSSVDLSGTSALLRVEIPVAQVSEEPSELPAEKSPTPTGNEDEAGAESAAAVNLGSGTDSEVEVLFTARPAGRLEPVVEAAGAMGLGIDSLAAILAAALIGAGVVMPAYRNRLAGKRLREQIDWTLLIP
jgi:hypothetical protein